MKHWRFLAVAVVLIIVVVAALPLSSASAAVVCSVDYNIQNDWGSGATVNVAITNTGTTAVNGWTLDWTFPGNQQITNLWSGSYTQSGTSVSVSNAAWNGNIAANGGSTNFGFNLAYSGTNAEPTNFVLNGIACNGGTPPTSTPVTVVPPTSTPVTVVPPTSTPVTVVPPTSTPTTGNVYQAEDATLGGGVSVDTNHTGYNGTGFVNFPSTGGYVEYRNVDGGTGGSRTLRFRHALGATSSRTGQMTVNGTSRNITFSPTGSWDTWAILEVTASLNAGTSNTIRLQSTGQDLANQDQMEVVGGITPPTSTPVTVVPPTSTPVTVVPPTPTTGPGGRFRVDANGNITKDGVILRVKGGSWFGLEGRHEPSNDPTNPSGAPMEQYMGNVFWAPSGRTYDQDIAEFKALGINVVRLPVVTQTLTGTDPQGMAPYLKNDPSVVIANSRLAVETIIQKLDAAGIYVLLDIHSCSNYVGWRAGRFDARPPYADANRDNYDFKREDWSCAASNNPSTVTHTQPYDQSKWVNDLRTLAGLESQLGVDNIIGIDIFNEPHDYTWAQWKSLIETAYSTINAVNPNVLIFAQGIGTTPGVQDGTPDTFVQEPHGVVETNPNWGENLYSAGANPPNVPKDRLVFSPHTYGPSVYVQRMFMDPSQPQCEGLEGDAAAEANCNIVINPALLEQGWQEHFGYLKAMGYAVVIGEFGGNPDWPGGKASLRDQELWSHITDHTVDLQWQTAFVNYLLKVGITDTIYWSINPESGDTGGIYTTPYQPGTNESGWGTWSGFDSRKVNLLQMLWNN